MEKIFRRDVEIIVENPGLKEFMMKPYMLDPDYLYPSGQEKRRTRRERERRQKKK